MRAALSAALVVIGLASPAHSQQSDARTVTRFRERAVVHPKMTMPISGQAGQRRCFTGMRAFKVATQSGAVLTAPVVLISSAVADDRWRAMRWATYSGVGYSYLATAFLMRPPCNLGDALV